MKSELFGCKLILFLGILNLNKMLNWEKPDWIDYLIH